MPLTNQQDSSCASGCSPHADKEGAGGHSAQTGHNLTVSKMYCRLELSLLSRSMGMPNQMSLHAARLTAISESPFPTPPLYGSMAMTQIRSADTLGYLYSTSPVENTGMVRQWGMQAGGQHPASSSGWGWHTAPQRQTGKEATLWASRQEEVKEVRPTPVWPGSS